MRVPKRGADELAAAGLCTRCAKEAPRRGYRTCQRCYEHHVNYWASVSEEKKEAHRALVAKRDAHRTKEEVRTRNRKVRAKLRSELLLHYGDRCVCCGEVTKEFLTLDHINNDGASHRRVIGRGRNDSNAFHFWLRANGFPGGIQILCWNCNAAKQIYKVCPHQATISEDVA